MCGRCFNAKLVELGTAVCYHGRCFVDVVNLDRKDGDLKLWVPTVSLFASPTCVLGPVAVWQTAFTSSVSSERGAGCETELVLLIQEDDENITKEQDLLSWQTTDPE